MEVEGSRSYPKPVQLIFFFLIYFCSFFKYISAVSWYNEETIGVPFSAEVRAFTLLHNVYTGFGSHVASHLIDSEGSFPVGKVAVSWGWSRVFL